MAVEGGGSAIQLQGHDLLVDDVLIGIAVGNVNSRVLTDSLGQSLFEALLEGARHVIDKGFLVLLQLLDGGVPEATCFSKASFSTWSRLTSICSLSWSTWRRPKALAE